MTLWFFSESDEYLAACREDVYFLNLERWNTYSLLVQRLSSFKIRPLFRLITVPSEGYSFRRYREGIASQSLEHGHFHIAARITLDISQQRVERRDGVVEMLVEIIVAGEFS
jgi:hypothetical protein